METEQGSKACENRSLSVPFWMSETQLWKRKRFKRARKTKHAQQREEFDSQNASTVDMTRTRCEECDTEYCNSWNYRRHVEDHHSPTVRLCDECELEFDTTSKLQMHTTTVHRQKPLREKKHLCDQKECSAKFFNKSDLKFHLALEHQIGTVQTYSCVLCQSKQTYRTVTNLNKHLRAKHTEAVMFTKKSHPEKK